VADDLRAPVPSIHRPEEEVTDLNSLKYTAEHEWIALDGGSAADADPPTPGTVTVTVGITDYAADKLGDVVFVDLPAGDSGVSAGQVCGEIESTKSVGELYAPLTGDVVAVNDAVVDDPSLVNSDPFGEGWLVKLRVDAAAMNDLLDREAYLALTGGEA
jgi:glycine cleavage system H protein